MDQVTLTTDRLRLRPWCDADRGPFAALNADPEVMEFFPSTLTYPESDAVVNRIRESFAERGWGLWAVDVLGGASGSSAFIGYVGLAIPRFEADFTPCVEVGWRLARHAWGRGFATEAARAAIEFGFGTLALTEIVSFTATLNQRSERVMQRLGMSHDPAEDFEHPALPVGHRLRRHVLYRLKCPKAVIAG